jgi:hypothetical protein
MESQEDVIDSVGAAELLGISSNNLRQLVFRKVLVPITKTKRRSVFRLSDVLLVKAKRSPSIPSV